MAVSISEIECQYFGIPLDDAKFSIELVHRLRGKLGRAMEENVHCKRYIAEADEEIKYLRRFKEEHTEEKCGKKYQEHQSAFASKFIEISQKNRNMVAEIESLKSKIKKLVAVNVKIQQDNEALGAQNDKENGMGPVTAKSEDVVFSSQQLTQVTNKMVEYRRQCQQMKIEIRNLTKALTLEIGEGVTPQTLSSVINSSNWRGRQQHIIALQQKVVDLQTKLNDSCSQSPTKFCHHYHDGGAGDVYPGLRNEDERCQSASTEELTLPRLNPAGMYSKTSSSLSQRPFAALQQKEMKKQEHIQKLTVEVQEAREEILIFKKELNASRARCQILDSQQKALRFQLSDLGNQLRDKQQILDSSLSELKHLQQELNTFRSREKVSRGQISVELQEVQHLLAKERDKVRNLQTIVTDSQDVIEKLENEKLDLKEKLEVLTSKNDGNLVSQDEIVNKISSLGYQLSQAARIIEANEVEYKKLMDTWRETAKEAEDAQNRCNQIQLHLAKAFAVVERSDQCILQCLDGAQICNGEVLAQVETTRALIRELKLGDLFSLEIGANGKIADTRNLHTTVSLLKKEVGVLRDQLQKTAADRKKDFKNFCATNDSIRKEYIANFPLGKCRKNINNLESPSQKYLD